MARGRIGELDQRVTLQAKTLARASGGASTATWSSGTQVWAKVRPLGGRERQQGDREEASSNYEVTIRYRDGIKEGDRILWRGRYLNVRFVRKEGVRPQYMIIEAEMGAAV